jgi:hypothetical protein
LSYYRVLGMPVLVALNAADTALAVEALTDQQAVAEAMQVSLHMFFFGGGGTRKVLQVKPHSSHTKAWLAAALLAA